MSRRKKVSRSAFQMNAEEERYFSDALRDQTLPYFRDRIDEPIKTPLKDLMDADYQEWCPHFINALKDDEWKKSLNALRLFRQYNVHIGYTMRGVFDHVFGELLVDDQISVGKVFHESRTNSRNRLTTIAKKMQEFREKVSNEPYLVGLDGKKDNTFRHEKQALIGLVENALGALGEIYEYELQASAIEPYCDSHARVRGVHMNFILPPDIYFAGQRWWDELATLMSCAAWILIHKMKRFSSPGRGYTKQAIRDVSRDLTAEDVKKEREEFRKNMPDFFERIETEPANQILDEIRKAEAFSPSPAAYDAIRIAIALQDGHLRFYRISE